MKFLNDLIGQAWTLLGLFIAYIVLEGTAKLVTGWCIVGTLVIWILTFPIRNRDDK
jgi:hypothetical protein